MTQPTFDFSGRVVVVTGGSRGVGAGIVAAFVAAGAHVVTCGRNEVDTPGAVFVAADIREPEQANLVIDTAVQRFGRLDVLVNNAGGSPSRPAAAMSPRFIDAILALNLTSAIYCAQAAHRVMSVQDEGGSIVNITSVSGIRASPGASVYGAAKAGLISLTSTLAVEWAPAVRINCVCAGLLETDAGDEHYGGPAGLARVAATVPLGRMGNPVDVAQACLFLASDGASYISGANLVVHGGGETPAYLTVLEGAATA